MQSAWRMVLGRMKAGSARVNCQFVLEREIESAAQDVREKVAGALRDLPPSILPPIIQKADPDSDPVLSVKGQALYDKIKNLELTQYTGRGAYTGFVDNKNIEENTDPVGPRPTARFLTPDPGIVPSDDPTMGGLHPRWLPRTGSASWSRTKGSAASRSSIHRP